MGIGALVAVVLTLGPLRGRVHDRSRTGVE
jgi:hypothetical protein